MTSVKSDGSDDGAGTSVSDRAVFLRRDEDDASLTCFCAAEPCVQRGIGK